MASPAALTEPGARASSSSRSCCRWCCCSSAASSRSDSSPTTPSPSGTARARVLAQARRSHGAACATARPVTTLPAWTRPSWPASSASSSRAARMWTSARSTEIHIFKATSTGAKVDDRINTWTYTGADSGPDVDPGARRQQARLQPSDHEVAGLQSPERCDAGHPRRGGRLRPGAGRRRWRRSCRGLGVHPVVRPLRDHRDDAEPDLLMRRRRGARRLARAVLRTRPDPTRARTGARHLRACGGRAHRQRGHRGGCLVALRQPAEDAACRGCRGPGGGRVPARRPEPGVLHGASRGRPQRLHRRRERDPRPALRPTRAIPAVSSSTSTSRWARTSPASSACNGGICLQTVDVGVQGRAEYVLPVPMGSPLNYYGVGDFRIPTAQSRPRAQAPERRPRTTRPMAGAAPAAPSSTVGRPTRTTTTAASRATRTSASPIPSGATINGIEVRVKARSNDSQRLPDRCRALLEQRRQLAATPPARPWRSRASFPASPYSLLGGARPIPGATPGRRRSSPTASSG